MDQPSTGQASILETVRRLGMVYMFSLINGLVAITGFCCSFRELSWMRRMRYVENCRAEGFDEIVRTIHVVVICRSL